MPPRAFVSGKLCLEQTPLEHIAHNGNVVSKCPYLAHFPSGKFPNKNSVALLGEYWCSDMANKLVYYFKMGRYQLVPWLWLFWAQFNLHLNTIIFAFDRLCFVSDVTMKTFLNQNCRWLQSLTLFVKLHTLLKTKPDVLKERWRWTLVKF